jgi:hypothetical protein
VDDVGAARDLDDIARRYEEALRVSSSAVVANDGAARANRLFDKQRKDLLRLRVREEGQARIEAFMADADPGVRLMAASEVLLWDPAGTQRWSPRPHSLLTARRVLASIT